MADEQTRRALAADPLVRYWDDLLRGEELPSSDLDPAIAETIRRFQARDDAPAPDLAFVRRLRADLLGPTTDVLPLAPTVAPSPNGRIAPRPWQAFLPALPVARERRRWAQAQFATALLLLVTLGAIYVSFAPNWRSDDSVPAPADVGPVAFLWQTTGAPGDPLKTPSTLAVDPRGDLWVVDSPNHRFQIFASGGAFLEVWGAPGGGPGQFNFDIVPESLWGDIVFDASGGFYVADTGNFRIQKFDADRRFVTAWGEEGVGDGQFLRPIGIALGADGRVYVTDNRRNDVQVFDSNGRFLFRFGGFGSAAGQFKVIGLITAAPDGSLWVADLGNYRIQHFAPDGTFIEAWGSIGSGDGQFLGPNDVAVDEQGRVFVLDLNSNRVQVFDSEGLFLAAWGGPGSGEGEFSSPYGIALDGAGQVYVAEWYNNRVQAFRLGRQIRTLSPSERDA